jgi:sterol 22-desaturase
MSQGHEPSCLLDFWMVNTVAEIEEAQRNNLPPPPHSTDAEIGHTTLDFLFAAQDASTASLVWVMTFLSVCFFIFNTRYLQAKFC